MSDSSGGSGGAGGGASGSPQGGGPSGGGPGGGGGGRRGRRRNRRPQGRGPGTSPPRTDPSGQSGAAPQSQGTGTGAATPPRSTPPQSASSPRPSRPPGGGQGRPRPQQQQSRGTFQPGSQVGSARDEARAENEPDSERSTPRDARAGRTEGFVAEPHDDDSPPGDSPLRMLEVPSDPKVEVVGEALPFDGAASLPTGLLVQVAHVRLHATGQVAEYEVSGDSVTPGELVVVETEHGTALGTVTQPVMARKVISATPSQRGAEGGRSDEGGFGHGHSAQRGDTKPPQSALSGAGHGHGTNGDASAEGAHVANANKSDSDVDRDRRPGRLRTLLRKADVGDSRVMDRNLEKEKELLGLAKALVRERRMPMKMFRAHVSHGSPRAIFYFTADERIDFRDLVRELSQRVRLRIELRQVGVRDEAKRTGGIGDCGRELCCTTFLPDFAPVTIKMAKEQNIVLNPARVSGQCGRLKCCLVYEYAQYQEARKHLPRVGHMVTSPEGDARVAEVQTLTGKIRVQLVAGGNQVFLASELRPAANPHPGGQAGGPGRSANRPGPADRPGNRPEGDGSGRSQGVRPERATGQLANATGSAPPATRAPSSPSEGAEPAVAASAGTGAMALPATEATPVAVSGAEEKIATEPPANEPTSND